MWKPTLSIVAFVCLLAGSASGQQATLPQWLLGNWVTPAEDIAEYWTSVSATEFTGTAFGQNPKTLDYEMTEVLKLSVQDGILVYTAIIDNGKYTASFTHNTELSGEDDLVMDFKNNDFPQRLHYHRQHDDTLRVTLSSPYAATPPKPVELLYIRQR